MDGASLPGLASPPLSTPHAVIATVFRALARDSLIPTDPRLLGTIAMRAIGDATGSSPLPLPGWFGSDVDRDADWLEATNPPGVSPMAVASAMAWECGVPHTGVTDEAFRAGMMAIMDGSPRVAPGFALWRQADGRQAVADVDPAGYGSRSGIRAGDVLVSIDGRELRRPTGEIMTFYTDLPDTVRSLEIDRQGNLSVLESLATSGPVPGVTLDRLSDGTGHLRIRWFARSGSPEQDTAALALRAIAELAAEGAPGIVIDVRSGIGGDPNAVASIASALCGHDGPMVDVVHTDGRHLVYERSGPILWPDAPIAVLVNEASVSAAECLAIALEELADAVIVGTPTAGGLNGMRAVDLGGGYALTTPLGTALGPRSGVGRPGMRVEPHIRIENPTATELRDGTDPPLEAARLSLQR